MTSKTVVWIWKPLASTAFVVLALHWGAWSSSYGRLLLVALCCSWIGDILLIPESSKTFLAGLLSFFLAHVAFAVAFAGLGIETRWMRPASAFLALSAFLIGRWLLPFVVRNKPLMKIPVVAYMGAITLMVAFAAGAAGRSGNYWIVIGATLFYLSDISVARDKFVSPGWPNKAWGIPLYYAAQFILASTVRPP